MVTHEGSRRGKNCKSNNNARIVWIELRKGTQDTCECGLQSALKDRNQWSYRNLSFVVQVCMETHHSRLWSGLTTALEANRKGQTSRHERFGELTIETCPLPTTFPMPSDLHSPSSQTSRNRGTFLIHTIFHGDQSRMLSLQDRRLRFWYVVQLDLEPNKGEYMLRPQPTHWDRCVKHLVSEWASQRLHCCLSRT